MAALTGELRRLLSGEILSKRERRGLTATVISRWLIMASVLAAIYTAVLPSGDVEATRAALTACVVTMLASYITLTFRGWDYKVRGCIVLCGITVAGILSESSLCPVLIGRSAVFFAVPIAIAPVLIVPWGAIAWWGLIQAGTIGYVVYTGVPYPFYTGVILLIVAVVSWLNTARADRVIDRLLVQKQDAESACTEAEAAIDVIVSAETDSIHRSNAWLREIAGRLKT